MNKNQRYAAVEMMCPDLSKIPAHHLPPSYSIREYQQDDEIRWQTIQSLADRYNNITPELFHRAFGTDIDVIKQRQFYILNQSGQPVGTSTAWFSEEQSKPNWGRIHWIAIIPEEQGKGLAKPLLSATCQRLQALGHSKAYLTTANERIIAINLYLKFKFQPTLANKNDLEIWKSLEPMLREPVSFSL